MLIYGNTPKELRQMFLNRYGKALWILAMALLLLFLVGCGTAKNNGSSMSEFWKALGSGDISVLKEKFKVSKEKDDDSWEEVVEDSKQAVE